MKKKILIFLGVVLVVFGLLLVAPNLIDGNRFKPLVIEGFEAATGRQIIIDGDLSLKLIPSPALSVRDVSLANIPGGQAENFLELESLDLRLELFPLLSGDYKITSLVLVGGNINLERDASGIANWEALFAADDDGEEEAGAVALDSFILKDTTISYTDLRTGRAEIFSEIDAELTVTSLSGPLEGEGELIYRDVAVEFSISTGEFSEGATVPLNVTLIPGGDGPGVSFIGTYVEEGGIRAISGALTAGGDNAEILVGLMARAGGLDKLPEGNWQNAFSGEATIFAVLTETKTEITLDPLALTFGESEATGAIALWQEEALEVEVTLSVDTIDLDPWMGSENTGENDFELPEEITATLELEIGAARYKGGEVDDVTIKMELAAGRLTIEQIQAAIPGNTSINLYGTVEARSGRPVFSGHVDLESRTLKALLDWLEVDYSDFPNNRLNRFTFSGKVRYADPIFETETATATLDSTRFTGGLTLNLEDLNHFAVTGSLNNLDLDSYFPALAEKSEASTLAERVKNLQETLQGFADYTGLINLKAARLKLMGANLQGVDFIGNILDDGLMIQTLEVRSFEGTKISFTGSIEDISGAFGLNIEVALSSNNLGPVMTWAEIETPFEERVIPAGNLDFGLNGNLARVSFDVTGVFSGVDFSLKGIGENLSEDFGFTADLSLDHASTVELIRKFSPEYFPAKTALGAFSLDATITGGEGRTSLDNLTFQLGPAAFQGNLTFADRGGRSFIGGELTVRNLTMDDFMAPTAAGLEEAVNEGGPRWSRDQWDVDFLQETDFDVRLGADSLTFRTYRFLNPKVRLIGRGGVLTIENLIADIFDGTMTLNATMDATMNSSDVPILEGTLDLTGVSTEAALKASADITNLTGTLSLVGSFRGVGNSQEEVISTLSGSAVVSSEDGLIKGINMPRLSEQMATLDTLSAFSRVLGAVLEGGQTPYRYIRTEAIIAAGIISFDAVDADVDATEMAAHGRIDLPGWDMDITGAIRLKDQEEVPAIGVSMKGRVDEPEVNYDYIALTAFMTKRFTSNLFQQLLNIQTEEEGGAVLPEGEGAASEEEAGPTPEQEIIKGLFDLFGGDEEEAEEEPVEEDEGGG